MEKIIAVLKKVPLFEGISDDILLTLLEKNAYQLRSYEKGRLIFQAGDPVENLIILAEGTITAEMLDPSGKALKIEDATAPQTLASAFMYGDKRKIPVNVTATKPSKFLYIPKPEFQSMLMQSETLLANYIDIISSRAQFLSEKIKFMSFNTIRQKIAHFLLDRMKAEQEPFHTGMSQTAIAELFGVARPSLARSISEMEDEGIIYCERGYFTVFNISFLKNELIE